MDSTIANDGSVTGHGTNQNPNESSEPFERKMGVVGLVFTVLAFNAPLGVTASFLPVMIAFGNVEGTPLVFAIVGVHLTLFAVGLVAMSRFMHSPGAFYSYITAGLGKVAGLGGAFMAIAAYASFSVMAPFLIGIVIDGFVAGTLNGPSMSWWVWGLLIWAISTGLSMLNIEISARVLGIFLVLEVVFVFLWGTRVFFDGGPSGVSSAVLDPGSLFAGSLGLALLFGAMNITGFEAVAVFRSEAKDPVRNVPRATYIAVISMSALYFFASWAYLTAYGDDAAAQGAADPTGSFVASVDTYVSTAVADTVTVLMITSGFAAILAIQNIGARYFYTLGVDGVLPRTFGKVSKKQRAPQRAAAGFAAIALTGIVFSALVGIDPLRGYSVMSAIGALFLITMYAVTCVAILKFFRSSEHDATVWQAVIAPALSLIGLVVILYLAIDNLPLLMGGSRSAANFAVLVVVVTGVSGAALAWYYRRANPQVFAKIGSQDL